MSTTDLLIAGIVDREGGYVNHSDDKGGPTNYGITLSTLAKWRGVQVGADDVRRMPRSEAVDIYRMEYVIRPKFDRIPDPFLQEAVVDAGVNHGPETAAKWLQAALGVKVDGQIGPMTLGTLLTANIPDVTRKFIATRVRAYGKIISQNRSQAVFAAGWADRVAGFVERIPV